MVEHFLNRWWIIWDIFVYSFTCRDLPVSLLLSPLMLLLLLDLSLSALSTSVNLIRSQTCQLISKIQLQFISSVDGIRKPLRYSQWYFWGAWGFLRAFFLPKKIVLNENDTNVCNVLCTNLYLKSVLWICSDKSNQLLFISTFFLLLSFYFPLSFRRVCVCLYEFNFNGLLLNSVCFVRKKKWGHE